VPKSTRKLKAGTGQRSAEPQTVAFEYIKSQLFRVVHADGAVGGVTPSGNLHIAFFSERPAIPRMLVHQRNPDGTLGDLLPEQTVVRPGIIREMDFDVVIRPEVVDTLLNWLQDRKSDLKKHRDRAKKIQMKQPRKRQHRQINDG
jgi:hypothetical protein